jgi:hypothetical protein
MKRLTSFDREGSVVVISIRMWILFGWDAAPRSHQQVPTRFPS